MNQKNVGFFSANQVVTTDTTGTVMTTFFPTAMAAQGPVTITVTTQAEDGGSLTSSFLIELSGM